MKNSLIFATSHKGKVEEAQGLLGMHLEIVDIKVDEVQSMDLEYVARKKVESVFEKIKKPVIVDDVSLELEALNGFPGPFVKFMLETMTLKGILELMKNEPKRDLIIKSAVGYHDGTKPRVFVGSVRGTLAFEERGKDGFGFDFSIIPQGQNKTYAEMGLEGKNKLSHRKKAFDKLKKFLDSQKT